MAPALSLTPKDIASANDLFRQTFIGGRVVMTIGIQSLPEDLRERAITKVREFNYFCADNDPHSEHDFGAFEIDSKKFFWKIDYYDTNYAFGADPYTEEVKRLLTIMLAEEY